MEKSRYMIWYVGGMVLWYDVVDILYGKALYVILQG